MMELENFEAEVCIIKRKGASCAKKEQGSLKITVLI
jgi:hypothetical protein